MLLEVNVVTKRRPHATYTHVSVKYILYGIRIDASAYTLDTEDVLMG